MDVGYRLRSARDREPEPQAPVAGVRAGPLLARARVAGRAAVDPHQRGRADAARDVQPRAHDAHPGADPRHRARAAVDARRPARGRHRAASTSTCAAATRRASSSSRRRSRVPPGLKVEQIDPPAIDLDVGRPHRARRARRGRRRGHARRRVHGQGSSGGGPAVRPRARAEERGHASSSARAPTRST